MLGETWSSIIDDLPIPLEKLWPLCWPTDVMSAQMADLLFFLPHNTTTLYDVSYPFTDEGAMQAMRQKWPDRPLPDKAQVQALKTIYDTYRSGLSRVDKAYFPPSNGAAPREVGTPTTYGFPRLVPPLGAKDPDALKQTQCIGAGIQY
jgi:hypothetical protein